MNLQADGFFGPVSVIVWSLCQQRITAGLQIHIGGDRIVNIVPLIFKSFQLVCIPVLGRINKTKSCELYGEDILLIIIGQRVCHGKTFCKNSNTGWIDRYFLIEDSQFQEQGIWRYIIFMDTVGMELNNPIVSSEIQRAIVVFVKRIEVKFFTGETIALIVVFKDHRFRIKPGQSVICTDPQISFSIFLYTAYVIAR